MFCFTVVNFVADDPFMNRSYSIEIQPSSQASIYNIEYEIQSTSTGVCITCTFLDSSGTDCVAVVHHRISQLSSQTSGLMNITTSRKFTKSDNDAYGCIGGVDMKKQQVGVIGGIRKTMSAKSGGRLCSDYVVYDKLQLMSIFSYSESRSDQCSTSCQVIVAG
jgi:hypothetical protein